MSTRGRYIVFDGGEGVGKTTQVKRTVSHLGRLGIAAEEIREPGGDPIGERIRAVVLDVDLKGHMEAKTEVLLFNAARVQTQARIREKLEAGIWVVADRSYVSTMAYQGYGRGLDVEGLLMVCLYATDTMPDVLVVMTCDYEVALSRRQLRQVSDRFEAEANEFHDRVNRGFLDIAAGQRLPVVDASGPVADVEQLLWAHIAPLIPEEA